MDANTIGGSQKLNRHNKRCICPYFSGHHFFTRDGVSVPKRPAGGDVLRHHEEPVRAVKPAAVETGGPVCYSCPSLHPK
ncbi:hypothetical protein AALO_G00280360 [Alosa alosa]|uniref:Uncharacterized protein n=1 Tax=Alosa alosa TaxID=278164 RepID=A0AAV6FJ90_9TELE|nr:hypothetical protein AALO_G00280360 [Alosa alosa]